MAKRPPTNRKHRQSGQAIVTLPDGRGGRKDFLLGPHGSAASRREYARNIFEWVKAGYLIPEPVTTPDLTVSELLAAYGRFAATYYVNEGEPSSMPSCRMYRPSSRT